MINFCNHVNRVINIFRRTLIALLTHIFVCYIFQFVCVSSAGRRRLPIAVEC